MPFFLMRCKYMKCPYCANKPNMKKITKGHDNWWECPQCHKTIGKKEEASEERNMASEHQ